MSIGKNEAADLQALKDQIQRERSIDLSQYKDEYVKRRFAIRMREHSIVSYKSYAEFLKREKGEYDLLMNTLTVNVTEFFRDTSMWHALEKNVFPEIIKTKKSRNFKNLRIWSAGCSSGEEAYSTLILLKKVLGPEFDEYLISVYASDVDVAILEKARKGIYPKENLKNIDSHLISQNFDNLGDGTFQVKESLRKLIRIQNNDLIDGTAIKNFDIIFCRNVMIYFSRELQVRLLEKFYGALNLHGYFILGKTEAILGKTDFVPFDETERIYKKERLF